MHNSRPEVSSQRGESAEMMEQRVHEGALRGAGARVHEHSRVLIHHDHILIFVEYVDGYFFRSRSQRRARQDLDIDEVAGHDTLRSPRQTFANADAALVDQLLNASAAQIGKARGKVEIQTAARIFRGCGKTAQGHLLFRRPSPGTRTGLCLHPSRQSAAQR